MVSGESELDEAVNTVTGLFRQSLASILREDANLPSVEELDSSQIEDTSYSPFKHNLGTTDKTNDSNFRQGEDWEKRYGPLENESDRRGMDVNVKFTFDDSYLGEEEEDFADVTTMRVPEQEPGTALDLRERAENRKIYFTPDSAVLPRGNNQPVYFDPQVCKQKLSEYGEKK